MRDVMRNRGGAYNDFWAPVDPEMMRPQGSGVTDEEWDRIVAERVRKRLGPAASSPAASPTDLSSDVVDPASTGGVLPEDAFAVELVVLSPVLAPTSVVVSLDEDERECVTCLNSYEDGQVLRRLPCGHRFHEACAARWLRGVGHGGEGKRTCPLCVTDVTRAVGGINASPYSRLLYS
ncbi:hypothetical protein HK101_004126 [Irineochytrium annulatum]|nr:hypothetical protein HK101_004126 [Irineochytrium annulatum]